MIRERLDGSSAAEMVAIVNALHMSIRFDLVKENDHILMQTDCMSAIDAFENRRRELTKDERRAKTHIYNLKREHKLTFSFRHVKGHTNREGARYTTNRLCDMRAKQGMRLARERFNGEEGKKK